MKFQRKLRSEHRLAPWQGLKGFGGIIFSLFLPPSPMCSNKAKPSGFGAGNTKYFQTKRESLKLGNANMCLGEAYFLPSAQIQLGLINGLWKSMWYQKQGD